MCDVKKLKSVIVMDAPTARKRVPILLLKLAEVAFGV